MGLKPSRLFEQARAAKRRSAGLCATCSAKRLSSTLALSAVFGQETASLALRTYSRSIWHEQDSKSGRSPTPHISASRRCTRASAGAGSITLRS